MSWRFHDPRAMVYSCVLLGGSVGFLLFVSALSSPQSKPVRNVAEALAILALLAAPLGLFALIGNCWREWRDHRSMPALTILLLIVGAWLWMIGVGIVLSPDRVRTWSLWGAGIAFFLWGMGRKELGHYQRWETRTRSGTLISATPWAKTGSSVEFPPWQVLLGVTAFGVALALALLGLSHFAWARSLGS